MVKLSKSRVLTYIGCPAEYYKAYILEEKKETEAMRRGGRIHKFIERAYDQGWLFSEWSEEKERPVIRADKSSIPKHHLQDIDYLKQFHRIENKRLKRLWQIHGENDWKKFFFPVMQEEWVKTEIERGHLLRGFVDAVYRCAELDKYQAVDWKSGYSQSKWYTQKSRELEINAYAIMLRRDPKFEYEVVRGKFVHLMDHAELPFRITAESMKRTEKIFSSVGDLIEDERFACECGKHE